MPTQIAAGFLLCFRSPPPFPVKAFPQQPAPQPTDRRPVTPPQLVMQKPVASPDLCPNNVRSRALPADPNLSPASSDSLAKKFRVASLIPEESVHQTRACR